MIHPMTNEQRKFAETNHKLVYAYLQKNKLPKNKYYDLIIFGYLDAVQEYCENPKLKKNKFSVIAWKKMSCKLKDYQRKLFIENRFQKTVSFYDRISNNSVLYWQDVLQDNHDILNQLQTNLIFHDFVNSLPDREARIIDMKLCGDKLHDIIRQEHLTFRELKRILSDIYNAMVHDLMDDI